MLTDGFEFWWVAYVFQVKCTQYGWFKAQLARDMGYKCLDCIHMWIPNLKRTTYWVSVIIKALVTVMIIIIEEIIYCDVYQISKNLKEGIPSRISRLFGVQSQFTAASSKIQGKHSWETGYKLLKGSLLKTIKVETQPTVCSDREIWRQHNHWKE